MDPLSRDCNKSSLKGSSAPFSPDTDGDVDGDPVQPSVEDLELARKKKELEVIEEKKLARKLFLLHESLNTELRTRLKNRPHPQQ